MRYCIFYILILLTSCKSLKYNDRIVSYDLVSPKKSLIKVIGDFQEVSFVDNDWLRIMPAYFRTYSGSQNVLIVRITAKNKYGLDKFLTVASKEFGKINLETISDVANSKQLSSYKYQLSLKDIDLVERKNRLLNDVITLKSGIIEYKFAPSAK